jgi:hypothetical protein
VLKYYVDGLRTLLLGEGNLVRLAPDGANGSTQMVALAGASFLPWKGFMFTLLGERSQEDIMVKNAAWDAATLLFGWFPVAHCEFQLMGRLQYPEGGNLAETLFFQVHYYL